LALSAEKLRELSGVELLDDYTDAAASIARALDDYGTPSQDERDERDALRAELLRRLTPEKEETA
jgi:hypothetical protein